MFHIIFLIIYLLFLYLLFSFKHRFVLNTDKMKTIKSLMTKLSNVRLFACTALTASRSSIISNIALFTNSSSSSATSGASSSNGISSSSVSGISGNNNKNNINDSSNEVFYGIDWCIVDEAGQINIPTIIGPIIKAKKFVLVGG